MATGVQTLVLVLIQRKQLLSSRAEVKSFLGEALESDNGVRSLAVPGRVLNLVQSWPASHVSLLPSFLPLLVLSVLTFPQSRVEPPLFWRCGCHPTRYVPASAVCIVLGMFSLWLASDSESEGLGSGAEGYGEQVCRGKPPYMRAGTATS